MNTHLILCPHCDKIFKPTRRWQRFCTVKCRDLHWTQQRRVDKMKKRFVVVVFHPGGRENVVQQESVSNGVVVKVLYRVVTTSAKGQRLLLRTKDYETAFRLAYVYRG